MECFTLKLGNWKSCKKLEIKVNKLLASAANILKLEQYKEDQHDPCTKMNANSWTIPYFGGAHCGTLWPPRSVERRGHVYTYGWFLLIVWQKPIQYYKAVILQLKIKKKKTFKPEMFSVHVSKMFYCINLLFTRFTKEN